MISFFHTLGITDLWQLIAATTVFLVLPGVGTFCILSSTGKGGIRCGFSAVFGIMLGDITLMFLAAVGVAALLTTNPVVFKAIQCLGAIYIGYLGCQLLFARKKNSASSTLGFAGASDFTRSLLMTLINPKPIIFYMAFFPLFIDPVTDKGWLTFLTMGIIISICSFIYGTLIITLGHSVTQQLRRRPRLADFISRSAGAFLIGFGIKLTIS